MGLGFRLRVLVCSAVLAVVVRVIVIVVMVVLNDLSLDDGVVVLLNDHFALRGRTVRVRDVVVVHDVGLLIEDRVTKGLLRNLIKLHRERTLLLLISVASGHITFFINLFSDWAKSVVDVVVVRRRSRGIRDGNFLNLA